MSKPRDALGDLERERALMKPRQILPSGGPVSPEDVLSFVRCQETGCREAPTREATANGWAWQPLCQKHADERTKTGWKARKLR